MDDDRKPYVQRKINWGVAWRPTDSHDALKVPAKQVRWASSPEELAEALELELELDASRVVVSDKGWSEHVQVFRYPHFKQATQEDLLQHPEGLLSDYFPEHALLPGYVRLGTARRHGGPYMIRFEPDRTEKLAKRDRNRELKRLRDGLIEDTELQALGHALCASPKKGAKYNDYIWEDTPLKVMTHMPHVTMETLPDIARAIQFLCKGRKPWRRNPKWKAALTPLLPTIPALRKPGDVCKAIGRGRRRRSWVIVDASDKRKFVRWLMAEARAIRLPIPTE